MSTVSRQRQWQLAHPEKYAAQRLAYQATKDGTLVRPDTCSRCPNPKPHAHHEDYSKPLEVVWLCAECHRQRHIELRAPELGARREARRQAQARGAARRARERRSVDWVARHAHAVAAGQPESISNDQLEGILRAVADSTGYLSSAMYKRAYHSAMGTDAALPCPALFEMRFGSWNAAVVSAGLQHGQACRTYRRASNERLVECVRIAIDEIGHLPSVVEYEQLRAARPELALLSRALIARRIPGWATVLGLAVASVQQSTLSATTLWWSCEGAIRNIDRACRELSEIAA